MGDTTTTAGNFTVLFFCGDVVRGPFCDLEKAPEPPHECAVIQRMSEAYRELCK